MGADLGANTEYDDGRLYFFFGDVAVEQDRFHPFFSDNANNSDFVAWTDDKTILKHGGHLAQGWNFFLPNDHQGATDTTGQKDWRFCPKCHGLFWNDDAIKGFCLGARGGGFHLHAVLKNQGQIPGKFAPFTVKAPIGMLQTDETPTGAFSYDGQVYVFIWVGNDRSPLCPKGSYLVSKRNPGDSGEFEIEFLFSTLADNPRGLWQVAPCVVKNAEHSLLPPSTENDGLVMFGHGRNASIGTDAIHLAWMPLRVDHPVRQENIHYYTGVEDHWSEDPTQAWPLPFDLQPHYTSVSAAWVPHIRRWILLYSKAINSGDFANYKGQIVARISANLREWTEPITLFDPERAEAYGRGGFMHLPGEDSMDRDIPPLPPFEPGSTTIREDKPGWAYGAFILNRFTDWDEPNRMLKLYYLLSTGRPYQVHLMHTRLLIPD